LGFAVEFSAEAEADLALILDFLFEQYTGFGEPPETALDRAADRLRAIRADAGRLARAPHRGTLHDDILPGLRHTTIGRAIFWFDVNETAQTVLVLGVFFGGQEHRLAMLRRLLEP
jgi:toxin ParE1/3/4